MTNDAATEPGAWALRKVGRAREIAGDLQVAIESWRTSGPATIAGSIAEDRLSYEVRLDTVNEPPVAGWALLAGDALHNLRSALDSLVWSFVDPAAVSERQARQVQFPICETAEDWDRRVPVALRGVPAEIVERIRGWQTFLRPPAEQGQDPLPLLNDLDIYDKHRLTIQPLVGLAQASFDHAVTFASDEAAARNTPPQVQVHEPKFAAGSVLLSGTTQDPIKSISGSWSISLALVIESARASGPVVEMIHSIAVYVEILIWKVTGDARGAPFSH